MLERIYAASNAIPKELDIIPELYAPTFLHNGVPRSAGTWQRICEGLYSALPDATFDLLDITTEEDRVFCRYVMHATHTGDLALPGKVIAATGRKVEVWGLELRRVKDGRFVELWSSDISQLVEQLEAP
jgi:predicted ester cyclase